MAMTTPRLFVYGTLRRLYGHERHSLLERYAEFEAEGTVQAQLFNLGNYPGIVPSLDASDRVVGETYLLEPSRLDDTLRQLDDYEGTSPANPEPHEYRREILAVRLADGSRVEAWAYVLNREPPGCQRIASGDYLERRNRDTT
jgi:pyruvate carboxylase